MRSRWIGRLEYSMNMRSSVRHHETIFIYDVAGRLQESDSQREELKLVYGNPKLNNFTLVECEPTLVGYFGISRWVTSHQVSFEDQTRPPRLVIIEIDESRWRSIGVEILPGTDVWASHVSA